MKALLRRHTWTVEEYHLMGEAGLFADTPRVELIDGEVLEMAPMGSRHTVCVMRLVRLLGRVAGPDTIVSPQLPLRLDDRSEPEPDVALLRGPVERYDKAIPAAADALLVIEVSDTTLASDRDTKAARYGVAGVPECWIVDLNADEVLVLRGPCATGYAEVSHARRGEACEVPGLPGVTLAVEDLLGPA